MTFEEFQCEEEFRRHGDEYLKVNVEQLIGAVIDYFADRESYNSNAERKKPYWNRTEAGNNTLRHQSDMEDGSNDSIRDICAILRIDRTRLECIARLTQRWERRNGWEHCFPVAENAAKILNFIKLTREEM